MSQRKPTAMCAFVALVSAGLGILIGHLCSPSTSLPTGGRDVNRQERAQILVNRLAALERGRRRLTAALAPMAGLISSRAKHRKPSRLVKL